MEGIHPRRLARNARNSLQNPQQSYATFILTRLTKVLYSSHSLRNVRFRPTALRTAKKPHPGRNPGAANGVRRAEIRLDMREGIVYNCISLDETVKRGSHGITSLRSQSGTRAIGEPCAPLHSFDYKTIVFDNFDTSRTKRG